MTIKGIICDFGGVLVLNSQQPAHQKWVDRLHMDYPGIMSTVFGSEAASLASIGKISEAEFWLAIKDLFKLSDQEAIDLSQDIFAEERINDELIALIGGLPPYFKKAILSNAFSGARDVFTNKFHLDKVFDLMVISAEEGIAKPDDGIYLLTAERLQLNPWEFVFIDDMLANAQAAAKVGMAAIHFKNVASTNRDLKTLLLSQGVVFTDAKAGTSV
jgi:epoxide hydrolase-like predicted phosphatase